MPPPPDAAEDYELPSDEDDPGQLDPSASSSTAEMGGAAGTRRSPYRIRKAERFRGVANRIIFSRYYILFYFVMMSLSLTTVVLSLMATHKRQCPPFVWHILEVIVNAMMVLEVSTRWVAYGKNYPMTPLNIIDLLLVLFCSLTLILVFSSPCADGTRQEEVLDTILLVIRNFVQFLRLGNILRRSGHSLLNPPRPIDLSQARASALALDLSDEEAEAERHLAGTPALGGGGGDGRRTLVGSRRGGYEPVWQGEEEEDELDDVGAGLRSEDGVPRRKGVDAKPGAGRENLAEEDEEMWDRLG